jgi:hypothetical protein
MFHSLASKENQTCADISSDVKLFFYALKRKHFVGNVLECLGLRYFMMLCNVADYKRWANK